MLTSPPSSAEFYALFDKTALTYDEAASLPLIAFYPVERVVLDVPLKIKERHSFLQLDGYDNSLNQGVDFRRFFEWFREREDSENESSLPQDVLELLLQQDPVKENQGLSLTLKEYMETSRDRQLTAVRHAISHFMPGFSNLRVRRKPRLHMSIDKNGQTLNVLQLSQGETLVISDHREILVYSLDNSTITQIPSQFGEDANSVLFC